MPIGRGVASVYSSTRVVHAVSLRVLRVYSSTRVARAVIGNYYACTVAHTCSSSIRAVVRNFGASILIVYSTRYALGGRYCSGTGV